MIVLYITTAALVTYSTGAPWPIANILTIDGLVSSAVFIADCCGLHLGVMPSAPRRYVYYAAVAGAALLAQLSCWGTADWPIYVAAVIAVCFIERGMATPLFGRINDVAAEYSLRLISYLLCNAVAHYVNRAGMLLLDTDPAVSYKEVARIMAAPWPRTPPWVTLGQAVMMYYLRWRWSIAGAAVDLRRAVVARDWAVFNDPAALCQLAWLVHTADGDAAWGRIRAALAALEWRIARAASIYTIAAASPAPWAISTILSFAARPSIVVPLLCWIDPGVIGFWRYVAMLEFADALDNRATRWCIGAVWRWAIARDWDRRRGAIITSICAAVAAGASPAILLLLPAVSHRVTFAYIVLMSMFSGYDPRHVTALGIIAYIAARPWRRLRWSPTIVDDYVASAEQQMAPPKPSAPISVDAEQVDTLSIFGPTISEFTMI